MKKLIGILVGAAYTAAQWVGVPEAPRNMEVAVDALTVITNSNYRTRNCVKFEWLNKTLCK